MAVLDTRVKPHKTGTSAGKRHLKAAGATTVYRKYQRRACRSAANWQS